MNKNLEIELRIFNRFEAWLKNTNLPNRLVGAEHSYMRGWYDSLKDVVNKLDELRKIEEQNEKQ